MYHYVSTMFWWYRFLVPQFRHRICDQILSSTIFGLYIHQNDIFPKWQYTPKIECRHVGESFWCKICGLLRMFGFDQLCSNFKFKNAIFEKWFFWDIFSYSILFKKCKNWKIIWLVWDIFSSCCLKFHFKFVFKMKKLFLTALLSWSSYQEIH